MSPKEKDAFLYSKDYPQYANRLPGLQITDIHEPINMQRMRKERLEKARSYMKEAGASVMLLLNSSNVRYTTSYAWLGYMTGGCYALIPLEGDPIVFGHTHSALNNRREVTWIKPENIRFYVSRVIDGATKLMNTTYHEYVKEQFGKQIKDALSEMKLSKEELVLDVHDVDTLDALKKAGIRTSVKPEILAKAQEIKTKDEIECFRVCAAIADLAHYELAKVAEPGKTERELAGYMDYIAMKNGAEHTPSCFVDSGQYSWPPYRFSIDKMLRVGDIFFADTCKISWNGYKSCCYRNYSCVTPPSQAAKDANKYLVDITFAALSECKPGNTTADMMKHWPDVGDFPQSRPANVGHGLSIESYGPPTFRRPDSLRFPYELKEGMVFAIEVETGIGDGQGVRYEDMVVVTKTGYEVLTNAPREIITTPLR